MTRNVDLLISTLRHIQQNPKDWSQGSWGDPCGTSCCFAGNAAILSGAEAPRVGVPAEYRTRSFLWNIRPDGSIDPWSYSRILFGGPEPESKFVADYAAEKLGLTDNEASWLFDAWNGIEYLEAAVHALVTGGSIDPANGDVVDSTGRVVHKREEEDFA